jgi:ABC-2 type transport system permease protein
MTSEIGEEPVSANFDRSVVLKEVRGPSALGGGWKRFFDLVYLMSVTEFKRSYFGTALGYVWSLARPLMMFAVLLEVFTHVFRLGSQVPHYPVLLLFNIVVFGFFSGGTGGSVTSIVAQEGIVRKTQFPRLAIPLAVIFTGLFDLGLSLVIVFVFIFAFGVSPQWTWFLFPVILLLLFVITVGVAMLLSALYPRFRDIGIIWTVVSSALFYATPVLYPIEKVSPHLREVISLNPVAPILELARKWIIDPHAPGPWSNAAGGLSHLIIAAAIYVVLCGLGWWVFNREAPRIAEEL